MEPATIPSKFPGNQYAHNQVVNAIQEGLGVGSSSRHSELLGDCDHGPFWRENLCTAPSVWPRHQSQWPRAVNLDATQP